MQTILPLANIERIMEYPFYLTNRRFTTYFHHNYRCDWPLNEVNKPRLQVGSAIRCRYLITPTGVIRAA